MLRIYWAIVEPDPTVNPKNFRENIAYNTLPYNFTRMLLLPHKERVAADLRTAGLKGLRAESCSWVCGPPAHAEKI
jgi:hypothetical protein